MTFVPWDPLRYARESAYHQQAIRADAELAASADAILQNARDVLGFIEGKRLELEKLEANARQALKNLQIFGVHTERTLDAASKIEILTHYYPDRTRVEPATGMGTGRAKGPNFGTTSVDNKGNYENILRQVSQALPEVNLARDHFKEDCVKRIEDLKGLVADVQGRDQISIEALNKFVLIEVNIDSIIGGLKAFSDLISGLLAVTGVDRLIDTLQLRLKNMKASVSAKRPDVQRYQQSTTSNVAISLGPFPKQPTPRKVPISTFDEAWEQLKREKKV